jgi:hypothetical protein
MEFPAPKILNQTIIQQEQLRPKRSAERKSKRESVCVKERGRERMFG